MCFVDSESREAHVFKHNGCGQLCLLGIFRRRINIRIFKTEDTDTVEALAYPPVTGLVAADAVGDGTVADAAAIVRNQIVDHDIACTVIVRIFAFDFTAGRKGNA